MTEPSSTTTPSPVRSILRAALEQEHRDIDTGIEAFLDAERHGIAPEDGTAQLRRALTALRRHIYLEEEFLFPPLRAAGMLGPIMVMLIEHGELWRTMDRLELELVDARAELQRATCASLLAALANHNGKEETILYSQADEVLSAEATAELQDFMTSEGMPPGWTCQRA